MRLGIEASNLRAGGGVTHLAELLRSAQPEGHGFSQVIVWGGRGTMQNLPERPWLVKSSPTGMDANRMTRALWQGRGVAAAARAAGCEILFVPGGSYLGSFRPFVTMSRNMQPFEPRELRRHGWSGTALRLRLLRRVQTYSFRRADGLIFLTRYARDVIAPILKSARALATIIPHGVEARFARAPREQLPASSYGQGRPFRILYVSIVNVYKHQWHVAEAVARLCAQGVPVTLDLVGPAYPPALARLEKTLVRLGPAARCVRYHGPVAHATLPEFYAAADLCLFASSCENMPNILLEGMASGLPVACSNRGPMPEVLGSAGVYFDPEDPEDIAGAVRTLIESAELRARLARESFARAQDFSWERCADETLGFLARVAQRSDRKPQIADGE
jgi:glycosyltransferase involved in cell wall biosynthesis